MKDWVITWIDKVKPLNISYGCITIIFQCNAMNLYQLLQTIYKLQLRINVQYFKTNGIKYDESQLRSNKINSKSVFSLITNRIL